MKRMVRHLSGAVLALAAFILLAGAAWAEEGGTMPSAYVLAIENREWEKGYPNGGWCGEASIQMAAGFFGLDGFTQRFINDVGRNLQESLPDKDYDLTEYDMAPTLDALGMTHEQWPVSRKSSDAFLDWIRAHIAQRHPVIVGVHDTTESTCEEGDYPMLNHLVLCTGFVGQSLVLNTNYPEYGAREIIAVGDLLGEGGYRLDVGKEEKAFFGVAVTGVK